MKPSKKTCCFGYVSHFFQPIEPAVVFKSYLDAVDKIQSNPVYHGKKSDFDLLQVADNVYRNDTRLTRQFMIIDSNYIPYEKTIKFYHIKEIHQSSFYASFQNLFGKWNINNYASISVYADGTYDIRNNDGAIIQDHKINMLLGATKKETFYMLP